MADSDAWTALLDQLEQGAAHPETLPASWVPPAGIAPMPPELEERVRTALGILAQALERVQAEQGDVIRQLGAVRAVPRAVDSSGSVYLDVAG